MNYKSTVEQREPWNSKFNISGQQCPQIAEVTNVCNSHTTMTHIKINQVKEARYSFPYLAY